MNEKNARYTRLFSLTENLYCANSPVAIAAGALQKDNQTGRVFVQLKLHNLQSKQIKAATVQINPLDTVGKPLGEPLKHQYLDLTAERDADFGSQTPIILPEAATRSFSASVEEIIFSDNTIWQADKNANWQPMPSPIPLEKSLGDEELAKQFRIQFGQDCRCAYATHEDLWRCACGAWNRREENICHKCKRESAALASLDLPALQTAKDKRLAEEAKQAEELAAQQAAKIAKIKKIAMVAVPIIVVLIIAGTLISNAQEKRENYEKAIRLTERGSYQEAASIFSALGSYKDSKEQLANAVQGLQFNEALDMIRDKDYDNAYAKLTEIADWGNAQEYLDSFIYVLRESYQDDSITLYYYNEQGLLQREENNGQNTETEYEYNDDGSLREIYSSNYPNGYRHNFYYNEQGNCVRETERQLYRNRTRQEITTVYNFADGQQQPTSKTVTTVNYNSSYPYKETSRGTTETSLAYDSQGRLTEERTPLEDNSVNVYLYEYDNHDNRTKITWQKFGPDGAMVNSNEQTIAYEYDEKGNLKTKKDEQGTYGYNYNYFFANTKNLPL